MINLKIITLLIITLFSFNVYSFPIPESGKVKFDIIRKNKVIGSHEIKFIKNIHFKIYFDNANIELTNEMKNLYYSPYFEPIYNQIINHDNSEGRDEDMINNNVTYVIIANQVFNGDLDEFINKRKKRIWENLISDKNE